MQFSFHLQYFLRGANIEKIFLLKRLNVNILNKRGMLNTLSLIKEGFPVVGVITDHFPCACCYHQSMT
jgi:hypothetical protein